MENLVKNEDTQKNVNEVLNVIQLIEKIEGLNFDKGRERSKKSYKGKIVDSISKEIKVMKGREDLELLFVVDKNGNSTNRTELRFHTKPKKDIVEFNIKYKSKIFKLSNDNKVMSCNNNITDYLKTLESVKNVIEKLEDDNSIFNQLKTKDNK